MFEAPRIITPPRRLFVTGKRGESAEAKDSRERSLPAVSDGRSRILHFGAPSWNSWLRILTCHLLPPVLPELLALAGVSVSMAVGATIPVEALCDSPGLGQLVWQSAMARDLPVLINLTLAITAVTLLANLVADTARASREAAA